jgi:hypothetical protein
MSLIPNPNTVPSESTVEQIANHQILCLLSPFGSWFYVPTKPEENLLGYDASLQGQKALVIQYKRLHPSATGGRVNLSAGQHSLLTSLFPRSNRPYVFYGFAPHPTYSEINDEFSSGIGYLFGLRSIFVNAHSIPLGSRSISVRFIPFQSVTAKKVSLPFWSVPSLVREFQACNLGLRSELLQEPPFNEISVSGRKAIPNLNILWASVR